jgi:hypothetical protein
LKNNCTDTLSTTDTIGDIWERSRSLRDENLAINRWNMARPKRRCKLQKRESHELWEQSGHAPLHKKEQTATWAIYASRDVGDFYSSVDWYVVCDVSWYRESYGFAVRDSSFTARPRRWKQHAPSECNYLPVDMA